MMIHPAEKVASGSADPEGVGGRGVDRMIIAAIRDDGAPGQITGGEKTEASPWFRGGIGGDVGDFGVNVEAGHIQTARDLGELG